MIGPLIKNLLKSSDIRRYSWKTVNAIYNATMFNRLRTNSQNWRNCKEEKKNDRGCVNNWVEFTPKYAYITLFRNKIFMLYEMIKCFKSKPTSTYENPKLLFCSSFCGATLISPLNLVKLYLIHKRNSLKLITEYKTWFWEEWHFHEM